MDLKKNQKLDDLKYSLKDNTLSRVVKADPKDKLDVEIGDSKQKDFKPQVKIKRWDNEVNFSIRAEEHPEATVETENEKVKYKTPDYEVHLFDKPEAGEDGGFEFEWLLLEKPSTNVLNATIQTKGLDFLYQGELTEEQIFDEGVIRPENVTGSYAVYHSTKKDHIIGKNNYKAGKAFHIYRPKIIDSNGDWVWGELNIDLESGILSVTIPQEFLERALYPIIVDPTFGYTSVGASTGLVRQAGGSVFAGADGVATQISIYHSGITGPNGGVQYAFYVNSTLSKVAETAFSGSLPSSGWNTRNLTSSPTISAVDYAIVRFSNVSNGGKGGGDTVALDTGTTNQGFVASGTGWNQVNTPSSLTKNSQNTNKYSMYVTYDVDAGFAPNVNDNIAVSEAITMWKSAQSLSVVDNITVAETIVARASPLSINVNDQITVSESTSVSIVSGTPDPLLVNVNDNITISESTLASEVSNVNVVDNINVSESIPASVKSYVSVFDII